MPTMLQARELHVLVPMLMVFKVAGCANREGYGSTIATVTMPTLTRHNKDPDTNFSISWVMATRKPVVITRSTATYQPTGSKGKSGKGTQDDATYADTSSNMMIP